MPENHSGAATLGVRPESGSSRAPLHCVAHAPRSTRVSCPAVASTEGPRRAAPARGDLPLAGRPPTGEPSSRAPRSDRSRVIPRIGSARSTLRRRIRTRELHGAGHASGCRPSPACPPCDSVRAHPTGQASGGPCLAFLRRAGKKIDSPSDKSEADGAWRDEESKKRRSLRVNKPELTRVGGGVGQSRMAPG